MKIIVPIFIQAENNIWRTKDGQALIEKVLKRIQDIKNIKKVITLTDDIAIHDLSKLLGIDSHLIELGRQIENSDFLPPSTHTAIQYLHETGKAEFDSLMVFNFRNPLITSHLLEDAINRFNHSNASVMTSVKKSKDHPVQLETYYNIIDMGLLHLFDDSCLDWRGQEIFGQPVVRKSFSELKKLNPGCDFYRITKPFHFNWESRGIYEKDDSGIYFPGFKDGGIYYKSLSDTGNRRFFDDLTHLWIYEDTDVARIIVPFNIVERVSGNTEAKFGESLILTGLSFAIGDSGISSAIFFDPKNEKVYLQFYEENFYHHSYVLKLLPFGLSGICRPEESIELRIEGAADPITFQMNCKDACVIVYCCLAEVNKSGAYDLRKPFPEVRRLWQVENATHRRINSSTGKDITGRQDFPDIFEPDKTFFMIKSGLVSTFEREITAGNIEGFVIDSAYSINVESYMDWLCCNAIIGAQFEQHSS
jgi:CMP-N-acetylneuraminic acid synthetase